LSKHHNLPIGSSEKKTQTKIGTNGIREKKNSATPVAIRMEFDEVSLLATKKKKKKL